MTIELFNMEEWDRTSRSLQRRINGLPYDTRMDCQRMLGNCYQTVTQIMKLEVEYRRFNKNAARYNELRAQLPEMIEWLEQHVMMAQLMR
jgi:hypothetical protein